MLHNEPYNINVEASDSWLNFLNLIFRKNLEEKGAPFRMNCEFMKTILSARDLRFYIYERFFFNLNLF